MDLNIRLSMQNKDRRLIELTGPEKRRLRYALLGYGKLAEASRITGLHINTLRSVNNLGHGEVDTIEKIRKILLSSAKETTQTH
jgi:hypothetical protein